MLGLRARPRAVQVIGLSLMITSSALALTWVNPFATETRRPYAAKFKGAFSSPSFVCPKVIPPVLDLTAPSPYNGDGQTEDPVARAERERLLQNVREYTKLVAQMADHYATTRTPEQRIAECTLNHLETWAKAGAALAAPQSIGYSPGSQLLIAAVSSYLKIESAMAADHPAKLATVRKWFWRFAQNIEIFYASYAGPATQINNHRYWAGYAVALTGVALRDSGYFTWGLGAYDIAMMQSNPDGTLSPELERGLLAHGYHLYALSPLVGIAELAREHGLNYYGKSNGRLHVMIANAINAMVAPELVTTVAPNYVFDGEVGCKDTAFLELYQRKFYLLSNNPQAPRQARFIQTMRDQCNGTLVSAGMGGDLTQFFGRVDLNSVIAQ